MRVAHGWKGLSLRLLGCWPCRTTVVALSLLAMLSQLTQCPKTLHSWHVFPGGFWCLHAYVPNLNFDKMLCVLACQAYLKKVQTSNRFWRTSFRRAMTKIERPCLQHVLWVHGLCSCPMLCLSHRWAEDKADRWKPEHGFAVRRSRRKKNYPLRLPRLTYTFNRTSRCLCHQLLC